MEPKIGKNAKSLTGGQKHVFPVTDPPTPPKQNQHRRGCYIYRRACEVLWVAKRKRVAESELECVLMGYTRARMYGEIQY